MQKQSRMFGKTKRKTVLQHAYYTCKTKILGQKSAFPLDLAPNQRSYVE